MALSPRLRPRWQLEKRIRRLSPGLRPRGKRARILVEMTAGWTQAIPVAFVATALKAVHNGGLVGFYVGEVGASRTTLNKIATLVAAHTNRRQRDLRARYRALGCSSFWFPASTIPEKNIVAARLAVASAGVSTLDEAQNFCHRGVRIGDLIYDDFLARSGKGTLSVHDPHFRQHLLELTALADRVFDYLSSNQVAAVVCPQVYRQGIIGRTANFLGIPSYEADLNRLAMSNQATSPWSDFRNLRDIFATFSSDAKSEARKEARDALAAGSRRVDLTNHHLEVPGGREYSDFRAVRATNTQAKILLALHCLSDSPHVFGNWLYPDYLVWAKATIDIAVRAGHFVIVKPHPHCPDPDLVESLVGREVKDSVTVAPADMALDQLVAQGLSLVVTAFGSIGFEAALRGVPVLCAHPNNPYQQYGFALSPATREHYETFVVKGRASDMSQKMSELEEFYFMSRLYFPKNLFVENFEAAIRAANFAEDPAAALRETLQRAWDERKATRVLESVQNFVQSGKNRLDPSHLPDSS